MALDVMSPLAFGGSETKNFSSVHAAQAEAARLLPGMLAFDFLDRDNFQFRTALRAANGLTFASISTPACRIRFGDRGDPAFVFPLAGRADFSAGKTSMVMGADSNAIFVPPGLDTKVDGKRRSVVVTRISAQRLELTARSILGLSYRDASRNRLNAIAALKIDHPNCNFGGVFRALYSQIDSYGNHQKMLDSSGIDDTFYRTLVMALMPDIFDEESRHTTTKSFRQIKRVCEYVMENLGSRITLTDLERKAFMSRRSLHNAFFGNFGLSPIEWVRNQRLLRARQMLMDRRSVRSVTGVLYACGFTQPSLFSAQYLRRFGESPSKTLRESRGESLSLLSPLVL